MIQNWVRRLSRYRHSEVAVTEAGFRLISVQFRVKRSVLWCLSDRCWSDEKVWASADGRLLSLSLSDSIACQMTEVRNVCLQKSEKDSWIGWSTALLYLWVRKRFLYACNSAVELAVDHSGFLYFPSRPASPAALCRHSSQFPLSPLHWFWFCLTTLVDWTVVHSFGNRIHFVCLTHDLRTASVWSITQHCLKSFLGQEAAVCVLFELHISKLRDKHNWF